MYFHVIENAQRDGVKGYRLVKTYKRYGDLEKWLLRTGEAVWVIESGQAVLSTPITGSPLRFLGGFQASYWNTGGWGYALMPVMPVVGGEK